MNIVKTLLVTTLAFTAFSTFAGTKEEKKEQTLISSSQEQPVNSETSAAAQPTTVQPGTEVAVDESTTAPTAQPAQ